ncbi:MAG: ROK family protein [Chloroflexi bacterium]|nr:ROK family protein [Chloroflexota bacterium]
MNCVGVDLGASKIALGLVDESDALLDWGRMPTCAELGPEQAVQRIVDSIVAMERAAGRRVDAVGVCSPGPVDHFNGVIVAPPNMPTWRNVPFRAMLQDALGRPVTLEHDAKASAIGEFHAGAGKALGARDLAFIIIGTGVGAAMIIDERVFRGRRDEAGEVGHVTIDRHGAPGSSGVLGCLESFTSGPSLERHYAALSGASGVTGEQIVHLANQGEPHASAVLDDAGDALAAGVGILAMVMDIDLFIIGGSVARAGERLLRPARAALPKYCYPHVAARITLAETALHETGAILGAAWQARAI